MLGSAVHRSRQWRPSTWALLGALHAFRAVLVFMGQAVQPFVWMDFTRTFSIVQA